MQLNQTKKNLLRRYPVLVISIAQFLGTSLWFSANSAAFDLMQEWKIGVADIGWLTNSVQAGFILGTFILAFWGLADRFRPSRIFMISALIGALFNLCFAWLSNDIYDALVFRFFVGLSLAGIYPIGMKLIIEWAPNKAGQALSLLVAMLTMGTALPYALNGFSTDIPWQFIITASSILALISCVLISILGDNNSLDTTNHVKSSLPKRDFFSAFKIPKFRAAALGYFGHMWELYTFWMLVPLLIVHSNLNKGFNIKNISFLSFLIIAIGSIGCLIGGILSKKYGSKVIALSALALSGICCSLFAFGWDIFPAWILFIILVLWSISVIADSPQFSALSAQACSSKQLGSALAIQNSIGFFITIVSIAIVSYLFEKIGLNAVWFLLIGPILGILGFIRMSRKVVPV